MKYHVYILYATDIDSYYIGYTGDDLKERLRKHNTNHKGFTGRSNLWKYVHIELFQTKKEAISRERYIKKQKSRKYIEALIE